MTRILSVLLLLTLIAGGAWYFLRSNPSRQIRGWRDEVSRYLYLSGDASDLEKAEKLNEKILQLVPGSARDLVAKARINERKGTMEGARAAMAAYDKVLQSGNPAVLKVGLMKARLCRELGRLAEARATLYSVADTLPFVAQMELGATAMAALEALQATRHYSAAVSLATRGPEEAQAREALAEAYLLLVAINSDREKVLKNEQLESRKADWRNSAREALETVRGFLIRDVPPPDEAEWRLVWMARVLGKLIPLKKLISPEENQTAWWEGARTLEEQIKKLEGILLNPEAPEVRGWLGAMWLRSAAEDEEALAEFKKKAQADFVASLEKTPEEAAALLGESGSSSEARAYLLRLAFVSRVYLASGEFGRLLNDASTLALSRRLDDVVRLTREETGRVFAVFQGLAHLKAGETEAAEKLLDQYLEVLPAEARPRGTVELAGQVLRLAGGDPREDPLVFRYLDRLERITEPLELLNRRAEILVKAREEHEELAQEASRRLDEALRRAEKAAETPLEWAIVARLLYNLEGRDRSIALLREAVKGHPGDTALRRLLAKLLVEKAVEDQREGDRPEAIQAYREALDEYVVLFVRSPAGSAEVITQAREILRLLKKENQEPKLGPVVKRLFPEAGTEVDRLARAVPECILGDFGKALERLEGMTNREELEPFFTYLKGSSHLGAAALLSLDIAKTTPEVAADALRERRKKQLDLALEEFRRGADFPACKLEALNLELQNLSPESDVPDDLLERIEALSTSEAVEHAGYHLLARALRHRFELRYKDSETKNSELARILGRGQSALREAIKRNSTYAPLYVALAETFTRSQRDDPAARDARRLFSPNYPRAIGVLKSAPEKNAELLNRLTEYLEIVGKLEEATPHLERLALLRPTAQVYTRLVQNYHRTRDQASADFLLGVASSSGGSKGVAGEGNEKSTRADLLVRLREIFQALPEYDGLVKGLLAVRAESGFRLLTNESQRADLREELIERYDKAVKEYEAKGLRVPILFLNNLAWHLVEDTNDTNRARGLELVRQARKRPDAARSPVIQDTYAWALFRNRELFEAKEILQDLLKAVDAPTFHYHLAHVHLGLKEFDEALREVRRALDSSGSFSEEREARQLEQRIQAARREVLGQ